MNRQKKIALINDISGMGRCSITVSLPILSAMKISCGIVPTAILSNQTEYDEYTIYDFTSHMKEYIDTWKRLCFSFDGICTGFLGSKEQIDIINDMIEHFHFEHIIIDPVMGDHGKIYDSYTDEMCEEMKHLVSNATIVTPNLTELCILTDNIYTENIDENTIEKMCKQLAKTTNANIIVTGIEKNDQIGNAYFDHNQFDVVYTKKISPMRPGTGDVFTAIIAGCILQKMDIPSAILVASDYISDCLITSSQLSIPLNDGVCFEEYLYKLTNLFS